MGLAAPTMVVAVNAHQLLDRGQMDVLASSNQLHPVSVQESKFPERSSTPGAVIRTLTFAVEAQPLRHTVASHGCLLRGNPGGR